MATLKIKEPLWRDFVAVAQQRRQKPESLAAKVLRDYLQHVADEELLAYSERAARRAPFRIEQTEELIRLHRRRKRKS